MRKLNWYIVIGILLVAAFVLGLAAVLLLFGHTSETLYLLLLDVTFLPLQVLIVTLVINRLLEIRERDELGQRVNIVIGVFFTDMGIELLRYLSQFDVRLEEMRQIAGVNEDWTARDFANMRKRLHSYEYTIDCHCAELKDLRQLLQDKREFVMGLLANSSLLEHETFTQLLWAVLHVAQELDLRPDLDDLPDADYAHLGTDMRRVYVLLVMEWLSFAQRLKQSQPYSFSLAVRLNPFAENPSATVEN